MKESSFATKRGQGLCLAVILAVGTLATVTPSRGAVTTYTSQAAFFSALTNPAYVEGFNNQSGNFVQGTQTYSLGGIGFTLTSVGSNYTFFSTGGAGQGSVFPTGLSYTDNFRINFIGNITAVGGNFFLTTPSFIPESGGNVTATLATGESIILASTDSYNTAPFGGFVSTTPITALTFTHTTLINGMGAYLSLDNLIVSGTAVPEPASWALLMLGGGGLVLAARRRAAVR